VAATALPEELIAAAADDQQQPNPDDTLTLLLLCCHPALNPASQMALTLRAVG
jgi:predicted RNA polymerase sigma factor